MRGEPMRRLLEGGALPLKLDELRQPLLAAIDEVAEDLERTSSAPGAAASLLRSDGSQAMAIMGDRGSGKSSLLASVSGALHQGGRHIVMPIMNPELFAETDSVITTFLAELWELLKQDSRVSPEARDHAIPATDKAISLLASTARVFAISRTTTAALEHGTDSPNDFAEDFVTVSRSGVRLATDLRRLTRELCFRPEHPEGPRLIIVPIDDPDLAHGSVVDMLNDIQILGSVPGIVPLTCFSPGDLNGAWITARKKMDSTLGDERLRFLLARHLEKVFPYRCRFEIEAIAPHERTEFVPIGGKGTLQRKLKTLRAEAEEISGATWPIDEALCQDGQRYNLPSPLPDNARTLVQLWEALDALDAAPKDSKEQMLHLTLKRATHILGEQLAARLGKTTSQMVHIGPPSVDSEAKRLMTCELELSNLFVSAEGSGLSMPDELSIARFSLRPLYRVRIVLDTDSSNRTSDSDPKELDAASISAVLAIQEIALGSGLYDVMGTSVYLGREEWRFLQNAWLANQPTDNAFLLLPNATTLFEVHRCVGLWNTLTDLSKGLSMEELLATAVRAACLARDPEAPLEAKSDYEKEFDGACETYLKCRAEESYTARAFVRWFEEELPMQWHSALISREEIRRFADRHKELRSETIEGDKHEQSSFLSFFDTRINVLLDALEAQDDTDISQHSWPAGYFELASAFGSRHLNRLSHFYTRWQRDLTGVHAGSATIGAIAQVRSKAVLAPYETPEGTQLVAAGIAALQRERAQARSRFRSE